MRCAATSRPAAHDERGFGRYSRACFDGRARPEPIVAVSPGEPGMTYYPRFLSHPPRRDSMPEFLSAPGIQIFMPFGKALNRGWKVEQIIPVIRTAAGEVLICRQLLSRK
jgi:hypothetical protein